MASSILKAIAQDLNRSILHGARQADENGKTLPSTMLDGRQSATTLAQLKKGVEVTLEEGGATVRTKLEPLAGSVDQTNAAVIKALTEHTDYFELQEEKELPTWICQQKLFSLPDRPAPENCVAFEEKGVEMKLLRLPPAVLHENALHRLSVTDRTPAPAPVSLCRVWQEQKGSASYQKLEPLARDKWQPAILVRCPMIPAWASGSSDTPVFELKGVPQDERWYLDQLNLLPPMSDNGNLPQGSRIKIWVEKTVKQGEPPDRIEILEWVLARRNLTVLARPGETQLQADAVAEPVPYPYAVTEKDEVNTLRLLQMGSITNSGGYYFRPHRPKKTFEHSKCTLVVGIFLAAKPEEKPSDAQGLLPLAANAMAFPVEKGTDPKKPEEPSVVRFEGDQHLVIEPYTPTGCVAFGWRRILPKVTDPTNPAKELEPTTPVGFARSIHLLDFEVTNDKGDVLEHYREKITWEVDRGAPSGKRRTHSEWLSEPCRGDSGPALSPVKRLKGQTDGNNQPLALLPLDTEPEPDDPKAADQTPLPARYFYRNTLRLAIEEMGYSYLADPALQAVNLTAAYRDIFGNRLLPGQGKQRRELYYGDSLTPPGEWPGFTFRMFPSSPGRVTLEALFRAPKASSTEKDDLIGKLKRIKAQLKGAADDVTVSLVDAAESNAPFIFTLQGTTSLKAGLLSLLDAAIDWKEQPEPLSLSFAVEFNSAGGNNGRPCVFSPLIVIKRERPQFHPRFDELLGAADSFVKEGIRAQILRCQHAVSLAANAFKDDPVPSEDPAQDPVQTPTFRDVAVKFSKHLSAAFKSQAAGRRNRFNEHELWFVPNALFPVVGTDDPIFSTPRPLNTSLGVESFQTPDFLAAGTVRNWRELPRKQIAATRVDYDLMGRRAFELLDQLAQPLALTERTLAKNAVGQDTSQLLWNAILSSKDDVAKTLGDAGSGYIVPFFEGATLRNKGVTRMCQDAFQRDLRLFYSIDTLVQWPVEIPATLQAGKSVINFYGVSTADIVSTIPAKPKFSDFVLNPVDDADGATRKGHLTVTYDLPPDGEKNFNEWTTKTFTAQITHLQLPTDDEIESRVFNQGQWLELLSAEIGGDKIARLDYTPNALTVPAILRRFPDEPIMPSCKASKPPEETVTPAQLAQWGWEVKFDLEKNSNDTITLEVEYTDPEKPQLADTADDLDEWPSTSLLQDLVVLGQLANQPLGWWSESNTHGPVAMQAFPLMLRALNKHLLTKQSGLMDDAPKSGVTDHFSCLITSLSEIPKIIDGHPDNQKRKRVVAQIAPVEDGEIAPATGMTRFVIKAEADGVTGNGILSLFGEKSATTFRPNLRLRRNDSFLGRKATSSLVYVCAPVYYPELVRVANRFSSPIQAVSIPPDTLNEVALKTKIKAVLEQVLGTELGGYYDLRVDCKHSFSAGAQRLANAFLILPVDYKYTTVDALAGDLAKHYLDFLGKDHASEVIQSVSNAALVLGLQVASKKDAHVLLEVDALEFAFKP